MTVPPKLFYAVYQLSTFPLLADRSICEKKARAKSLLLCNKYTKANHKYLYNCLLNSDAKCAPYDQLIQWKTVLLREENGYPRYFCVSL